MVRLTYKYLAYSRESDRMVGFSEEDLTACVLVAGDGGDEERICRVPDNGLGPKEVSCEEAVYRHQENATTVCQFWAAPQVSVLVIRMYVDGRWVFKFKEEERFTVGCGPKLILKKIKGFGQIDLEELPNK